MVDLLTRRCKQIYYHQKARAHRAGGRVDYSCHELSVWVERALEVKPTCRYCGNVLDTKTFQLDHDNPVSRSGDYRFVNLVVCCPRCNQIKGKLKGEEFIALLELIRTWPPAAGSDVLSRLRAGGKIHGRQM